MIDINKIKEAREILDKEFNNNMLEMADKNLWSWSQLCKIIGMMKTLEEELIKYDIKKDRLIYRLINE